MKHHVVLFLGNELQRLAAITTQNVLKRENEEIWKHFSTLVWAKTKEKNSFEVKEMVHLPVNDNLFYPDEDYLYQVGANTLDLVDNNDEQIKALFNTWFNQHVLAGTAGAQDRMQMVIVMKASDTTAQSIALKIASLLNEVHFSYDIDLLLLSPDIYAILTTNEGKQKEDNLAIERNNYTAKNVVEELIKARRTKVSNIFQILLLQNRKKNNAALNLDINTIGRIISEYVSTCIENYDNLYNPVTAKQARLEDKVVGIGLACLDFDKYYFLNYLLHNAYIYILEREGINGLEQNEVDVTLAARLARESLKDRLQVLTTFYDTYILPETSKGRTDDNELAPEISANMTKFVDDLEKAITKHITNQELTLPQKFAVIAQILLIDEDMLAGNIFDKEQPAFIDLLREPVNFFIDYYNENMEFETDEDGEKMKSPETGLPIIKNAIPGLDTPQDQDGHIFVPIDDLKRLRMEIRQASEFIRDQTDQLVTLEKTKEETHKSDDVVIENDNYFRQFKLIGDDIKEDPLKDNYEPKPTKESNIDLSHDFTPVKNQGPVGACTTFAVSAIYEYILKKNYRSDHDLSERFLYYNSRKDDNRLDKEGTAISTAIRSVGKTGICTEEIWPYSHTEYNVEPSQDAYNDAEARKIKKAMNVVLGDDTTKNRDALRSAIAEGYPVVISLNLFEAFDHIGNDGMVPVPSSDDKQLSRDGSDSSRHAMVACGYDDKNEVFKVRNSWGERFGKDGYCYVPYAYMCDHKFLNCAYIITEVTDDTIKVRGVKGGYKVMLDIGDIDVKIALKKNAIAAKKKLQEELIDEYKNTFKHYATIVERLADNSVREQIISETKEKNEHHCKVQHDRIKTLNVNKGAQLDKYDDETNKNIIIGWSIVGLAGLLALIFSIKLGLYHVLSIISILIFAICLGGIAAFYRSRQRGRDVLEARIDDEIVRANHDYGQLIIRMKEFPIRSLVAGLLVEQLTKLNNNLLSLRNSLNSYIQNLSVWLEEEKKKENQLNPDEHFPFITLINNHQLDTFFNNKGESLTEDIHLYEVWNGNYTIEDKEIFLFKNKLKNTIKNELSKALNGFNVYEYIAGLEKYEFLESHEKENDMRPRFLKQLDEYSETFLQLVNSNEGSPQHDFFVMCNDKLSGDWRDLCSKHTKGTRPQCGRIDSVYKLLEIQTHYIELDNITIFHAGAKEASKTNGKTTHKKGQGKE